MYAHPRHRLDPDEARDALSAFDRAAILITAGAGGLMATHVPLALEGETLVGHLARANPHWREGPCEALVICAATETYISPGWYETKKRTQRAVPTWNYETLHAYGRLTVFEDKDRLRSLVAALSDRHEAERGEPWALDDAPADYIEALLGAIVGVEIAISGVEGKRKLSQEKPAEDRAGVIAGLQASPDPRDHAVALAMTAAGLRTP